MNGFTYRGIHCGTFGCSYYPDAKARGGWMADFEVCDMNSDARDGGYYLGARVKPRVFTLDCYFEDISEEQLQGLQQWLRRDTQGRQVFDEKPLMFYDVAPGKKITISLYEHDAHDGKAIYSGTFEATFVAHEPFGKMLMNSYAGEIDSVALYSTGILPSIMMPPAPTVDDRTFLIYNPGTESAHTIIRLAGDVGDGLTIRNLTTGQRCRVVNLKDSSMLPGACLELDSYMGQTRTVLGDKTELAFPFHDEGYITLAPCTPFVRALTVAHRADSNIVTTKGLFSALMNSQYLYLDGWKKISRIIDASTAVISQNAAANGVTDTPVVTMNELHVEGENAVLSRLEVEYTPRV